MDLRLLRCLLDGLGGGGSGDEAAGRRAAFLLRVSIRYCALCPGSPGPVSDLRSLIAWAPRRVLHPTLIRRIVSGGQTGADRGGLDAAIALGIPIGGWCPSGRRAEDGVIPAPYAAHLRETADSSWSTRTRLNIRDSDATLICSSSIRLSGGSALTWALAARLMRPRKHLVLLASDFVREVDGARTWLAENRVAVLNVAGPRESKEPGVEVATRDAVMSIIGRSPRG